MRTETTAFDRTLGRAVLTTLLGAMALGCAGAPPLPPAKAAESPMAELPFAPTRAVVGERLDVSVIVAGVPVGAVALETRADCERGGDVVSRHRAEGRSTGLAAFFKGVEARLESQSGADGAPIGSRSQTRTGSGHRAHDLVFGVGSVHVTSRRHVDEQWRTTVVEQKLPAGGRAHDVHSVLLALRQWQAEPGDRAQAHVMISSRLWRVDLLHRGPDALDDDGRSVSALRIDGRAQRLERSLEPAPHPARQFTLWLSNDAQRIPLRARAQGSRYTVEIALRSYTAGDASASPRELSCND